MYYSYFSELRLREKKKKFSEAVWKEQFLSKAKVTTKALPRKDYFYTDNMVRAIAGIIAYKNIFPITKF